MQEEAGQTARESAVDLLKEAVGDVADCLWKSAHVLEATWAVACEPVTRSADSMRVTHR